MDDMPATEPTVSQETYNALLKKANKATRLLCELMSGLQNDANEDLSYLVSKELKAWYRQHQEADEARKEVEEAEAAVTAAHKKLADLKKKLGK